jgi:hypothetical protein
MTAIVQISGELPAHVDVPVPGRGTNLGSRLCSTW